MDSNLSDKLLPISDSPGVGPVFVDLAGQLDTISPDPTCTVSTFGIPRSEYQHHCFGFESSEDVLNFASALVDMGFVASSRVFLDEYWDTKNLTLMQSNIWLRTRDGKFGASRALRPMEIPLPIEQMNQLKDIASLLVQVGVLSDFSTAEERKVLYSAIQNCCSRKIASLPTMRTSYESPDLDCLFQIDTFKSGGKFWTLGSMNTTKSDDDILQSANLKDFVSPHCHSKLFISLKADTQPTCTQLNSTDMRILLSSCLNDEAKDYASFTGIPSDDYPFECFDTACELSLRAKIPLELGFRSAFELEQLV